MNVDAIIAVAVPLCFFLSVGGYLYFVYKSREKRLDTLVKIVELGGNVDPEMMQMLSHTDRQSYKSDYRKGLIWLSIGIPLTISIFLSEGLSGALIGSIFIFIGVSCLISGHLRWREND